MGLAGDGLRPLDAVLTALIVRRIRIGLGAILAGVLVSIVGDHALMGSRPAWADGMDLLAVGLVGTAYWLLSRPIVQARPVPFALLIVAITCGLRAASGIWFADVAPTAMLCVLVALAAGVTLPWGMWPQLAAVALSAAAIIVNAAIIGPSLAGPPVHLFAAVFIALSVSVVLSLELERHHTRMFEENVRRRSAETDLARLNTELELRVEDRTAEFVAAKQRLEREALERQQATQELRESQKRLQDILDNAPAAIYLKDPDGRYLLVNRQWETLFDLHRAEVVGKLPHSVHPAAVAEGLLANDRAVLASRQPLQVEEALQVHGEPRAFLSVKFPLYDTDEIPVAVCGISTDITRRKQMEAELRRSEASLSALVENTVDAIWSVDRQGVITVMNAVARERFRARFGTECERLNHVEQLPSRYADQLRDLYARALEGEHVQVERAIRDTDVQRHFLLSLHPIVENGVVTGATAFSKDISELKHAEALAREHQAELAHVLRLSTMGEMAAGLAHEINQPLGAIAGYAQGCVRRLRAGVGETAELLPIVEEIAREALRAGAIIRRLRELVRKGSPARDVLDLNGLVRDSTHMIEAEARRRGIRVRTELAADLPRVSGDGIQIEQVLLNLLLNGVEAVQASSNGERTVTVTTGAAGAAVEVAVRDSGIGIPPPPSDVFAPFFTTKPNGLGMGLSISRSIIEAHGGHLSAARNADHGSTFRFTLPPERTLAS